MEAIGRLSKKMTAAWQSEAGRRARQRWARLLFPLLSAAALAWFLVRVLPKPIRATYPCQRAAFPLASAFVIWLLGIKSGLLAWLGWKRWREALRPAGLVCGAAGLCALVALAAGEMARLSGPLPGPQLGWTPGDPPNSPMGTAKGIFPGRVVWMRDTNATPWNGTTGHWWDDETGVKQAAVDRMLAASLQALTAATNNAEAWARIFRHFNATHGRGETGYRAGETLAVKVNCNNNYSGYGDVDNQIDAAPQTVRALLRQLVYEAGVPQENILVYEAVRVVPDRIYEPCHAEFPGVVWLDSLGNGSNGRQPPDWHTNAFNYSTNNTGCGRNIPERVFQATYLINMALLKGHWRAGVSLTGKNHFGSIDKPYHTYAQVWELPMGTYNPFVDLLGARALGGKTLLFMIDGLYGVLEVQSYVDFSTAGWTNLFGGGWSASYFLSLDPVAIDSVGLDFLRSEFGDRLASGHNANADNYLHEAALAGNPPSGKPYRPDGTNLPSLGVHEHWNNAALRQYSRNLGATNGIELVKFEASTQAAVAITTPPGGAVLPGVGPIKVQAAVVEGASPVSQISFFANGSLLAAATGGAREILWTNATPGPWSLTAVATDANHHSVTSAVVKVVIVPLTPPVISRFALTNQNLELTFTTTVGSRYGVEQSESLRPAEWTSVGISQVATGTSLSVLVPAPAAPQRYYRVVVLP